MSIDFSTLKGLTIPEGNVTQITDESGRVIWKKAPSTANVKITVQNGGNYSSLTMAPNITLTIDGENCNSTQELTVPIGTGVYCKCSSGGTNTIYLNGAEVVYDTAGRYEKSYNYTVMGDIEIILSASMTMSSGAGGMTQITSATIRITEL